MQCTEYTQFTRTTCTWITNSPSLWSGKQLGGGQRVNYIKNMAKVTSLIIYYTHLLAKEVFAERTRKAAFGRGHCSNSTEAYYPA